MKTEDSPKPKQPLTKEQRAAEDYKKANANKRGLPFRRIKIVPGGN
jgi:hypothetical protein